MTEEAAAPEAAAPETQLEETVEGDTLTSVQILTCICLALSYIYYPAVFQLLRKPLRLNLKERREMRQRAAWSRLLLLPANTQL